MRVQFFLLGSLNLYEGVDAKHTVTQNNFKRPKGPSIIVDIFLYDNFYRKRGRVKNIDKYHNFFHLK